MRNKPHLLFSDEEQAPPEHPAKPKNAKPPFSLVAFCVPGAIRTRGFMNSFISLVIVFLLPTILRENNDQANDEDHRVDNQPWC